MSKPFSVVAKAQMIKHDLSLRDLEHLTGYSFGFIGKAIRGKEKPQNRQFFEKMAHALFISPFEITEFKILLLLDLLYADPKLVDQVAENINLERR